MCHRIVSGAPPDNVRCTSGLHAELFAFGKIQRRSAIIHRTVRWRTGLSGVPAEQRLLQAQRSTATHLMRACARRGQSTRSWRTGQSTGDVRCTTDSLEAPQVRAPTVEPQWLADVAGAPDCPVRHATADFQRPHFRGWGYKYPNHPTFNSIQVFSIHASYKSYSIQF